MERTFSNWRSSVVGLGITLAIVAVGFAVAFW
jgi:hypothetical protein